MVQSRLSGRVGRVLAASRRLRRSSRDSVRRRPDAGTVGRAGRSGHQSASSEPANLSLSLSLALSRARRGARARARSRVLSPIRYCAHSRVHTHIHTQIRSCRVGARTRTHTQTECGEFTDTRCSNGSSVWSELHAHMHTSRSRSFSLHPSPPNFLRRTPASILRGESLSNERHERESEFLARPSRLQCVPKHPRDNLEVSARTHARTTHQPFKDHEERERVGSWSSVPKLEYDLSDTTHATTRGCTFVAGFYPLLTLAGAFECRDRQSQLVALLSVVERRRRRRRR